jgi:hypothetical protein
VGYAILEAREGHHDRAGELLERALAIQRRALGPRHPVVGRSLYNLACLDALRGEGEVALDRLREALDAGWAHPVIFEDPDFEALRGDPRFEAIVAEVKERVGRVVANDG